MTTEPKLSPMPDNIDLYRVCVGDDVMLTFCTIPEAVHIKANYVRADLYPNTDTLRTEYIRGEQEAAERLAVFFEEYRGGAVSTDIRKLASKWKI